ncbi:response regulator transcription factor [Clostridium omnivorum]|uniref:Stage 0 sporulation protein A homolog n=1 Tax=Clostridium omnivorum TaxID=1604902 RepID=A0ABQ5N5M4_9CLOT|nr:response regulator transcription factor [Clostridium sp. E14]GLC30521.1 DNA-binding response regulator [Clostridium sp. E14]
MQANILVIDDDIELCQLIKKCLEKEGISADLAHKGTYGLRQAFEKQYQLIVLDVMLPEMNGFDIVTELRKTSSVPVLMLTAKDSEVDKVSGLRLGADDYLTKPFNINEFIARVHSLIRRYTTLNNSSKAIEEPLYFKGLIINASKRIIIVNEDEVSLTGKEFDLLYFLALHKGQVFTKKQLYSNVWKDEYAFDDSNLMSFISKLRRKLEPDINNPTYIQTVWGVGYRFSQEV